MLQHAGFAAEPPAPMKMEDGPPPRLSPAEAALLAVADPSPDSRVSLIGPNTLELLCALLRRGSADVCATRICGWPKAGTADVAIIPGIRSPDHLTRSISGRVPVVARCGAPATEAATVLAVGAARNGAAGLLCAAPPYVRPTQEGIAAHVWAVAHAADLPVILYDVPGRVGVAVADETVARLHEGGLVAIKDTAGDLRLPLTRARSGTLDALGRLLPGLMEAEGSDAALPRLTLAT